MPNYGSDIGHWDVPNTPEVAEEACELVEHGLMDEESLRTFLFDDAITFWTAHNSGFFKGTAVEREVDRGAPSRQNDSESKSYLRDAILGVP